MSTNYTHNLEGIGNSPFLSLLNDTSADQDFTQADLDAGLSACIITDNNTVGMGLDGDKLFGKVKWVSQTMADGTSVPEECSVQARGIARFKYVATAPVV
ncbi:hypothetical protein ACFLQV_02245, partial [Calditrichota bacterium]